VVAGVLLIGLARPVRADGALDQLVRNART
jgi:hypothetical protein